MGHYPEDVMREARKRAKWAIAGTGGELSEENIDIVAEMIARGVIAERESQRERDAMIAETTISRGSKKGLYKSQQVAVCAGNIIATAIRKGGSDHA